VTLSQDGTVSCSYAINPTSQSFQATGGSGRIDVTAGDACSWSVAQVPAWITVTSGASGSGNGSVLYSVDPGGAARGSTFTVAGLPFKVDQAAPPVCTYSVTPTSQTLPAAGGAGRIDVNTGSTCAWSVSGLPPWISLSSGASFTGPGSVSYTVAANNAAAKSGSFAVAGFTFTVSQSGGNGGVSATLVPQNTMAAPGRNFDLAIVLSSGGQFPAAGVFDVIFDQKVLTFVAVRNGAPLDAAGKTITTAVSNGDVRIVIAGLNQKTIADGTVLIVTFALNNSLPPNGQATVSIANVQLADAQGQPLAAKGASGAITAVSNRCNLTQTGTVGIGDVQVAINLLLSNSADPWGQPVRLQDLQLIINAVLGLGCNR
jgi:hypothetical protein